MKPVNSKRNKSLNNNSKNKHSLIDSILYYIIFGMVTFIPITLYLHTTKFVSPLFLEGSYNMQTSYDVYSYLNFVFLVTGTILLVLCMVYKIFIEKYEIVETKYNYLVLAVAFAIILASSFSSYKKVALFGVYDSLEGAVTSLCYLILFITLINIKISVKRQTFLIYSLIPFLIINLILGLLYFWGFDILKQDWFLTLTGHPKWIVYPKEAFLSSTVYNPNYVSGLAGSLFALFFALSLFTRVRVVKIVAGVCAIIASVLTLVSLSLSGNILILIFFPVILGLSLLIRKKELKINLFISVAIIIAYSIILISFSKTNPLVWNESIGILIHKNPFEAEVTNINSNDPQVDSSKYRIAKFKSEGLEYYQKKGIIPKLPKPGLSFLSGRGYIWEKTIESWEKRPIIGYGLSTTPFIINNDGPETIAKVSQANYVFGVSHNMYLDWLFGTGIIGLLSVLSLLVKVLYDFLKQMRVKEDRTNLIMIGSFVIAFLVQGIVNSTRIQSSVIFWILLGLLVNMIYTSKNNESIN